PLKRSTTRNLPMTLNPSTSIKAPVERWLALTPAELAARLHSLGQVLSRTAASQASIEQLGRYPDSEDLTEAGLVIGEDGLDLRLALPAWRHVGMAHDSVSGAYALTVFDHQGRVLLQLSSTAASSLDGWAALHDCCTAEAPVFDPPVAVVRRQVEAPGLLEDWAAMGNVHDHFALLKRHGLSRYEANECVVPQFAKHLSLASPVGLFERLAAIGLELMLFFYHPGSVQIFTGRLSAMRKEGAALVFDMPAEEGTPATRICIEDAVGSETWRIRKPNEVGGVTSLEVFD